MTDASDDMHEATIKEAVQQFVTDQLEGRAPNIEEFISQYPGLESRLRRRIESLQKVDDLFEELTQTTDSDFELLNNEVSLVGRRIASFEVTEVIARGGMGIVYKARDTRLNRDVAVKALCTGLVGDSTTQSRFRREAQLLASLDHPNIAAIYDIVEESDCLFYLILEYVPGVTLAERLSQGRMEFSEALEMAGCIARAVSAAYSKGVVHRDLKPGNVKITPDGIVKVLDFGISKVLEIGGQTSEPLVTHPGHFVGTPAYASPEQIRGGTIDHRTDVWSFGCISYEMLTGCYPFAGESLTTTLANIQEEEPDWSRLSADIPDSIRVLLRRCLEKNPNRRLHHIGDAAIEISETLKEPQGVSISGEPGINKMQRPSWPVLVACCLAGLAIGLIGAGLSPGWLRPHVSSSPGPAAGQLRRFTITLPEDQVLSFQSGVYASRTPAFVLSPDGSRLVYVARVGRTARLFERRIDSFQSRAIAGTDGAWSPFFSPDGQSVGFFVQGKLETVSLLGGEPTSLGSLGPDGGACWGSDGMVYAGTNEGLRRVPVAGGQTELLLADSKPVKGHNPQILPNGKAALISTGEGAAVVYLETRKKKLLVEGVQYARYVRSGHLLYIQAGVVEAVPFNLDRCEVTGRPVPVLEGVMLDSGSGKAQFTCSDGGLLVYAPGGDTRRTIPVWVDQKNNVELLDMPARIHGALKLSPDGKRLAIVVKENKKHNIYVYDIIRGTETRLTEEYDNQRPLWTPDGRCILFGRYVPTERQGYLVSAQADGTGKEEVLASTSNVQGVPRAPSPYSWQLKSNVLTVYSGSGCWVLNMDERGQLQPILEDDMSAWSPALSPDGQWIAYTSTRNGNDAQVYVRPYPEMDRIIPISRESGEEPIWSNNGDKLFYRNRTKWMVVSISTHPEFSVGTPKVLFEGPFGQVGGLSYDVTPDGQRFLVLKPQYDDSHVRELYVVTNWFEELKRLVPSEEE